MVVKKKWIKLLAVIVTFAGIWLFYFTRQPEYLAKKCVENVLRSPDQVERMLNLGAVIIDQWDSKNSSKEKQASFQKFTLARAQWAQISRSKTEALTNQESRALFDGLEQMNSIFIEIKKNPAIVQRAESNKAKVKPEDLWKQWELLYKDPIFKKCELN